MIYCFTGMPLAGKSTMAKAFSKFIKAEVFSTGDLARSLGLTQDGVLEPSISELDLSVKHDAKITEMALEAAKAGCVLDGFPRSMDQVSSLVEGTQGPIVIFFVVENPLVIYDRMSARAIVQGRLEDSPEVLEGRLRRSLEFKKELEGLDLFSDRFRLLVVPSDCDMVYLVRSLGFVSC